MKNPAIEHIARKVLNNILGQSITERKEYGGMIYMLNGEYDANAPRTQGYGNTVTWASSSQIMVVPKVQCRSLITIRIPISRPAA